MGFGLVDLYGVDLKKSTVMIPGRGGEIPLRIIGHMIDHWRGTFDAVSLCTVDFFSYVGAAL